jgi:hypothetical protein
MFKCKNVHYNECDIVTSLYQDVAAQWNERVWYDLYDLYYTASEWTKTEFPSQLLLVTPNF